MKERGRLIRALIRHDFRVQVRTSLFLFYLISLTMITILTVLSGNEHCWDLNKNAHLTVEINKTIGRLATSWDELGRSGIFVIQHLRKCSPFRDTGGFVTDRIRLRTDGPPERIASLIHLLFGKIQRFTAFKMGVYWVSLITLLMGSMVITGEKQSRTLPMLWASMNNRVLWLLSKWIGRMASIWLGWFVAYGLGLCVGVIVKSKIVGMYDPIAMTVDFFAYGLLFTVWYTAGMAISAFVSRVDVAALVSLTCWVLWEFFLPWTLYWVLIMVLKPPTSAEFYAQQFSIQTRARMHYQQKTEALWNTWQEAALAEPDPQKRMMLQQEYEKSFKELDDAFKVEWLTESRKLERAYKSRKERFLRNWRRITTWLIPSRAFSALLGLHEQNDIMAKTWNFWRTWNDVVKLNTKPLQYIVQGEDPFQYTRPDVEKVPEFTIETGLPPSRPEGWIPFILLIFFTFIMTAFGVGSYEPQ